MLSPRTLDDGDCWHISGVRNAEEFFRAIPQFVPEATFMFLEGFPDRDIVALLEPYFEKGEYAAPVGTVWSWPQGNRRFKIRASPTLLARLSEAATHHAEPEICSHLHFYRDDEPLVQWFDAFDDPMIVSKSISRERLDRFCSEVHGVLSDSAD